MDYKALCMISPHIYFLWTFVFLESQAGSKFTGDHFNQCMLTRVYKQCVTHSTDSKTCWDMSKKATHPTGVTIANVIKCIHEKRWHFLLCLEHWCGLQKVQCWIFVLEVDCWLMFLMPLSMMIDCLMLLLSLPSIEVIKGAHAKSMTFVALSWALMMLLVCGKFSVEFSGWGWSLFDVFDAIVHDYSLFDVAIVITIRRGD